MEVQAACGIPGFVTAGTLEVVSCRGCTGSGCLLLNIDRHLEPHSSAIKSQPSPQCKTHTHTHTHRHTHAHTQTQTHTVQVTWAHESDALAGLVALVFPGTACASKGMQFWHRPQNILGGLPGQDENVLARHICKC